MFNALNSQFPFLFTLLYASGSCIVLFKKMRKRWFWITMILLPCLIQGIAFASGEDATKFRNGDKVFFECTIEDIEGISFSWDRKDFQGSKFVLECLPKFAPCINPSISVRDENSTRISTDNANDATNNGSQKSSLSITFLLQLVEG